jgi:hypothetical protein
MLNAVNLRSDLKATQNVTPIQAIAEASIILRIEIYAIGGCPPFMKSPFFVSEAYLILHTSTEACASRSLDRVDCSNCEEGGAG